MCRILGLDGCSGLRLAGGSMATMALAGQQERRSHCTWRSGSTSRPQYSWGILGWRSLATLVPGGQEERQTHVPEGQEQRERWREQQLRQGEVRRSRREARKKNWREVRGALGSENPG